MIGTTLRGLIIRNIYNSSSVREFYDTEYDYSCSEGF